MRKTLSAYLLAASLLAGCAIFQKPYLGMTEAELIAIRGQPDYTYQEGNIRRLEWSATEMGQFAYMAVFSTDGKLVAYNQVLTDERFALIIPGRSTQEDVIRLVGHAPKWNRGTFEEGQRWSYRYKENGVWDAMMTIYFDRNGIVEGFTREMDPLLLRD